MLNISLTLAICYAIIGKFTEKHFFNPVTVLNILWAIIIFCSSLHLYTLFASSNQAYSLILIGLTSFMLGYYFFKVFLKKIHFQISWNKKGPRKVKAKKKIRYHLSYVLLVCCILFILYSMKTSGISLLTTGFSLQEIGSAVSNSSTSKTGIINMLSFLIINPLYLSFTILMAVDFWEGKRDKIIIILSLLMTAGRIFTSGGRQAIIQLVIVFLIGASFSFETQQNKRIASVLRRNVSIILILITGVIVFALLSFSKTTEVIKTLYLDFAMQPYMLQTWSNTVVNTHAYGFSSLFGFVHPFLYLGKNLFHLFAEMPTFFANIYNTNQLTFSTWIPIGTELRANAYVSIFWYFYYDAQEFGIFLGMSILGILSSKIYKEVLTKQSIQSIANYMMIIICIVYSFTDMEFSKASFVLGWFYLNTILIRKNTINLPE